MSVMCCLLYVRRSVTVFRLQTQGTFLNSKKVQPNKPKQLTDGSVLSFGTSSTRYVISCDSAGAPPYCLRGCYSPLPGFLPIYSPAHQLHSALHTCLLSVMHCMQGPSGSTRLKVWAQTASQSELPICLSSTSGHPIPSHHDHTCLLHTFT